MPTNVANYGNVTVLTVRDDLAGEALPSFVNKVGKEMDAGQRYFVVDCSGVHGIDSAGLESLLDVQDRCEGHVGAVKLCSLDETCRKILEITRLDRRFEVFEDLESAVKSFS